MVMLTTISRDFTLFLFNDSEVNETTLSSSSHYRKYSAYHTFMLTGGSPWPVVATTKITSGSDTSFVYTSHTQINNTRLVMQ